MFDTGQMLQASALPDLPDFLESVGVATLTGGLNGVGPDDAVAPIPPVLAPLFPGGGLRRGSTITVSGSSSLVLALVAEVSRAPGWCAEVGSPLLGSAAAAEAGVALERFVRVERPGEQWATVTASLLEAFDLVVVHPPVRASQGDMRRLTARARERSAVLLVTAAWEGAQINLAVTRQRWQGIGAGHGDLRAREVEVRAMGRGAAARPHAANLLLPGIDGTAVARGVASKSAV
jgi:hypothetical protein